jgi:SAM-dependent methyltransferase
LALSAAGISTWNEGGYLFADYDNLGGVRERVARRTATVGQRSILDVGTGAGAFACALAVANPEASVLGLDLVAEYLPAAEARRSAARLANCSFSAGDVLEPNTIKGQYDLVATFLSCCDLLRFAAPKEVLDTLADLVRSGGELLLTEAFPELAQGDRQVLGFEINQALGYRYVGVDELTAHLERRGFELVDSMLLQTGRPTIPLSDLGAFITDEVAFCRLDGSPAADAAGLLAEYQRKASTLTGVEVDAQVLMLRCRKKA